MVRISSDPKKLASFLALALETDAVKENPIMTQRFAAERAQVLDHHARVLQKQPGRIDQDQLRQGVREYIEINGLFVPTAQDQEFYDNPDLGADMCRELALSAIDGAIRDVVEAYRHT